MRSEQDKGMRHTCGKLMHREKWINYRGENKTKCCYAEIFRPSDWSKVLIIFTLLLCPCYTQKPVNVTPHHSCWSGDVIFSPIYCNVSQRVNMLYKHFGGILPLSAICAVEVINQCSLKM